jgi:hypothetical protein
VWKDRLLDIRRRSRPPAVSAKLKQTTAISTVSFESGEVCNISRESVVEETTFGLTGSRSSSITVASAAEVQLAKALDSHFEPALVRQTTTEDQMTARQDDRRERKRRILEAEKAAARSRTRANVLRHFVIPGALVAAGLLAGGAWMLRKKLR